MKSTVSTLGQLTHRIDVTVTPQEVHAVRVEMMNEMQKLHDSKPSLVNIPLSEAVLEKMYGDQVRKGLPQQVVQKYHVLAIQEAKLAPVSTVAFQMDPFVEGQDFHFYIQFETKPVLKAIQLKGISFPTSEAKVTEPQIEQAIKEVLAQHTNWEEIADHQPAQKGDTVMIDFQGWINGQPVPKTFAQNQRVDLGSGVLIPGFEDGIVGMKKNEHRDLALKFPSPYPEAGLAGKAVVFKVHLKNMKKKIVPVLTDEFVQKTFAKSMGAPTNVAGFRKAVERDLLERQKAVIFHQQKVYVLQQLVNKNPFEVPQSLVLAQKNALITAEKQQANLKGLSTAHIGTPQYEVHVVALATEMVRAALLVEAIAEQNGLTATPADIENHIRQHAQKFGVTYEQVKAQFNNPAAMAQIGYAATEHKVMEFLQKKLSAKAS